MATCSKCNANVSEGMSFCTQCGAPLAKIAPAAPPKAAPPASPSVPAGTPAAPSVKLPAPAKPLTQAGPKPAQTTPQPARPATQAPQRPAVTGPARPAEPLPPPTAKPAPPGKPKFEGLDVELPPPDSSAPQVVPLVEEDRRRATGAIGGVTCRFCNGPLDLEGGFCENCGAPVEEAAPPGMVKPKPKPVVSAARPAVPPPQPAAPPQVAASTAAPAKAVTSAPSAGRPVAPEPAVPAKPKLAVTPAAPQPKVASPAPPPAVQQEVPASAPPPAPLESARPAPPAPAAPPPAAGPIEAPRAADVPAATTAPAEEAPAAVVTPKKAPLIAFILVCVGFVIVAGAAAAWYFLRHGHVAVQPPPQAAAPQAARPQAPPSAPEAPAAAPTQPSPALEATAPEAPRPKRVVKPAPTPAPAQAAPAPDAKQAQLANLQSLAREAYAKGSYAEPADTSAIAYLKQALAINPNDDYSRKLLASAVDGGTYQVQQAIAKKDFATAHRLADAMAQLLPGRSDVAGLKEDIASAQRAEEAAHRPQAVAPVVSFPVMHMHTDKSPADKGPYCQGTLSVSGGHLKFVAQSATDGQPHNFDIACSDVREVKKNARVASHQGGFHVRTTEANYNFVPAGAGISPVPALASACSK